MEPEITEIDELILSGALEPAGIDTETGEMLYTFTSKLKNVNPLLHKEMNNMFSEHIMKLWEYEMIEMDVTEPNPVVKLTPKAFDENAISKLDKEIIFTLKEIKRTLYNK